MNIKGQVIGLNTWIASPSGGNVGLGFAIPINNSKSAIDDFINKGKIEYGWLGVTTGDPAPQTAQDLGITNTAGGFVYGVVKGSPADQAGLLPGDYITAIDSQGLKNSSDLTQVVGNTKPGDTRTFSVMRDGKNTTLNVKIATRPDEQALSNQNANEVWPGIIVVDITDTLRQQLNIPKNAGDVVVGAVDNGGPASSAGIRTGDIIKKINNTNISSVKDFYKALNDTRSNNLMLSINRNGSQFEIGISK